MNIEKLKLPPRYMESATSAASPPRPQPGEHFLKGPVPMGWLRAAAQSPGKVMCVAIYLWYLAGLTKRNRFPLPTAKVNEFGVDRFTQYRALKELVTAGLISVDRHRGRHPIITLHPAPAKTVGGEDYNA
jgi:hypothetical protein